MLEKQIIDNYFEILHRMHRGYKDDLSKLKNLIYLYKYGRSCGLSMEENDYDSYTD